MDVPKESIRARQELVGAVQERLGAQFFSHTVIFARTPIRRQGPPEEGLRYLVGSGTLVQVDDAAGRCRYGVLTCAHVLSAFDRAPEGTHNESLTLIVAAGASGGDRRPHAATVPYFRDTAVIVGAGNTKSTGPDLAWLPLNAVQALSLQSSARSRAVFYNLTAGLATRDEFRAHLHAQGGTDRDDYLRSHACMAVGWNKEIHSRDPARGGIWMNEVVVDSVSALDGWQLADYRINDDRWSEQSYGDGTMLPTSWQGLSGGSVWHVWRPDPAKDHYEKMLLGVVFYQIRQSAGRSMTIRAHSELSLVRLLHRAGIAPAGTTPEEEIVRAFRDAPPPAPEPFA